MFQRIPWILSALVMIAVPPAAAAPPEQTRAQAPTANATKPGAKPGSQPGAGVIPPAMGAHRPPTPPPSHSHYDVPQAKSLAETPDVVLNSKVRASLISALTAANEEDITPQTVKGIVTLTGSVKTKALRARAEQVARNVHGVRAAKNQLSVGAKK